MASIAITITGLGQNDLEEAVHALSRRFKAAEGDVPSARVDTVAARPARKARSAAPVQEADPPADGGQLPAADAADATGAAAGADDAALQGDAGTGDLGRGDGEPAAGAGDAAEEAPAPEIVVTFDDIKLASRELAKAKSVDAVVKVLADFGAAKPQELKEADYPAVLTALREAA